MADCSSETSQKLCVCNAGCKLNSIITINGATGSIGFDTDLASQSFTCAKDKFTSIAGDNVFQEIRGQAIKIFNTSTSATEQIFLILFGGVAIVLFLLVLVIFAALYWRDTDYMILSMFIIALLILIIAALVMYFWVNSVFDSASTSVTANLDNLNQILMNVQVASIAAFCCFSGVDCARGQPCGCSLAEPCSFQRCDRFKLSNTNSSTF